MRTVPGTDQVLPRREQKADWNSLCLLCLLLVQHSNSLPLTEGRPQSDIKSTGNDFFFFCIEYKTMPVASEHTTSTLKEQHSFWFRFENLVIYSPSTFVTKKREGEGRYLKQFLRVCRNNSRTVSVMRQHSSYIKLQNQHN